VVNISTFTNPASDDTVEFGIEGKVYVSFAISKDGLVKNAVIRKFADPLPDKEALHAVKSKNNMRKTG
jgi:outer membrane biosynthesis protein TonB